MEQNLDIIFLQKTMCSVKKFREALEPWLKNWSLCALDVEGLFGVLLIGWSANFKSMSTLDARCAILVLLKHKDCDYTFTRINVYGLYSDRNTFWEALSTTNFFKDPHIRNTFWEAGLLCIFSGKTQVV
jgi:hypothetical protein